MSDEQPNIPDLPTEKLRLEIEELKVKIEDQKKSKVWDNYVKPIIPVAVTLIIGIWGSILTNNYNTAQLENTKRKNTSDSTVAQTQLKIASTQLDIAKDKNKTDKELSLNQLDISKQKNASDKIIALTQLEIAREKNESDKTIAQINASLTYVKLLQDIKDSNKVLRNQAQNIIAPVLPPEMSFYIATEGLPQNGELLEILLKEHKEGSWKYLSKYIEVSSPKEQALLQFLYNKQYLTTFFNFLISKKYTSQSKVVAISKCLPFYVNKDNPYPAIEKLIKEANGNKDKGYVSKAAALAFCDPSYSLSENWNILNKAALYFWEDYDVTLGEAPHEGSIDQDIYHRKFHITWQDSLIEIPATETLSQSLYRKLIVLNYNSMNVYSIERILYSYCETSPRFSKNVFTAYLKPVMIYQLLAKILPSLNSEQRKREFANYLGSISGDMLFRNISQDKTIGKKYSEILITWYRNNWKSDWYSPQFMSSIITIYPDLKPKMEKKWGIWID
ncbi:MAG TPA: hypothetical protein VGF79_13625 [Bacteroidia bacterium]